MRAKEYVDYCDVKPEHEAIHLQFTSTTEAA